MHRCQRLVHPSKQFWNWFCGMAFRATLVLLLMSSMSSKCLIDIISFIFGNRKKSLEARSGEKARCSNTVICLVAKNLAALIQAPTFSRWYAKTHAYNNRCHSERRCHRSAATTQLLNTDMSTSSNHTKAFVQCCHGKHTVASSRT